MYLSYFCCVLPRTLQLIDGSHVMYRSKHRVRVLYLHKSNKFAGISVTWVSLPCVNATTRPSSQLVWLTSLNHDSWKLEKWKSRNDTACIQIVRSFIPCLSTYSLTLCVSLWGLAVELLMSDTNNGFGDVVVTGETVCVCIFSRNVPFNVDVIIDMDDVAIGAALLWPFAVDVIEIVLISCGVEGCSVTGRADGKTPRDELFTDDVSWPKRHERLLLILFYDEFNCLVI